MQGGNVRGEGAARELQRSNAELVQRAFRAFARRDVDAVIAITDPEVEFFAETGQEAGEEGPNWERGAYWGHEGVVKYFEHVSRIWTELEVFPDRFHSIGDTMLVLGRVRARDNRGALRDIPAQWLWRLRDGRIVYWCVYTNRDEALEAAGVDPDQLGHALD